MIVTPECLFAVFVTPALPLAEQSPEGKFTSGSQTSYHGSKVCPALGLAGSALLQLFKACVGTGDCELGTSVLANLQPAQIIPVCCAQGRKGNHTHHC